MHDWPFKLKEFIFTVEAVASRIAVAHVETGARHPVDFRQSCMIQEPGWRVQIG
jgi:hypothetical protein